MIWNYTRPIIIYRRFLKPKVYEIIDRHLQNELESIFKHFGYELE